MAPEIFHARRPRFFFATLPPFLARSCWASFEGRSREPRGFLGSHESEERSEGDARVSLAGGVWGVLPGEADHRK
jgi:hypothetical protein